MRGLKRQEWFILGLEAALLLLLFFCYRRAVSPETVDTWGSKVRVAEKEKVSREEPDKTATEKKVAITFDDGPNPVYTPKLLDGLKERDVKATFFVLGKSAEQYPELIERMQEEGHIIGNHTYSHIQLRRNNWKKFREELILTNEVIEEITGESVQYVRPPYGTWDKKLEEELSMFPILWSVDPNDWCTNDTDRVVQNIVNKTDENDIILLHDCYKSSVDAALESIDILKERGYSFVTVEELLFE